MRIRMTQHLSGSENLEPGMVYDRPEPEAKRLIDAGFAVAIEPETAVKTPIHETAISRPKRRK